MRKNYSLLLLFAIGSFFNAQSSYTLDLTTNQININVSNYLPGLYTIALIVNGEVVDSETLIKQ